MNGPYLFAFSNLSSGSKLQYWTKGLENAWLKANQQPYNVYTMDNVGGHGDANGGEDVAPPILNIKVRGPHGVEGRGGAC